MTSAPQEKPDVRIGDWLKEGWEIVKSDIGMFILASLIYNLILATCIGGLILYGPLTCGMYIMMFDRMRGGKADIRRFFTGFEFFGESFFAGFLFYLLAGVGLSLAGSLIGIIIVIFLQAAFLFTFQLITNRRTRSVEAISMSFEKVRENFWQFVLFAFVLIVVHTAGYLLIVGWLITTPIVIAASAAAYRDIFGFAEPEPVRDVDLV